MLKMRKLKVSREGSDNQGWKELGICFERIDENCGYLYLPQDMWFEEDEHQLYQYKILCHRNIILGYIYDDKILINYHGKDLYLTARYKMFSWQEYI